MNIFSPITHEQQQQVIDKTEFYIQLAASLFQRRIKTIPVYFDLTGRASGMYIAEHRRHYIRYNPYIFAKYFEDNLQNTVPHEVAHYVSDLIYGLERIKPHGNEWKMIMQSFQVTPSVTSDYDLTGIPVRRLQRFEYKCTCMTHQLSAIRHNKIIRGKVAYLCRHCSSPIVLCE